MLYGLLPPVPEVATIRVVMLRTDTATLDGGATTMTLEAGREYDLPEWLAEAYFRDGKADPAEAHQQPGDEPRAASEGGPEAPGPSQRARKRKSPPAAQNGAGNGA